MKNYERNAHLVWSGIANLSATLQATYGHVAKPIRGAVVNTKRITIRCGATQNAVADNLLAIFV